MNTTFRVCDRCYELTSESVRVSGQTLCEDCHDTSMVFCSLCGIAGVGDPTQDRNCKDCMDQAILGFDDYKLV